MRSSLLFFVLIASIFSSPASNLDSKPMIELRARCAEGNPCHFTGEMFVLELELFNAGQESMTLPIEYFRRRGPRVTLVDNHSGKEVVLHMGPRKARLMEQLQVLAPGESIRFPWWIPDFHISDFALKPVDITAKFRFHLTPQLPIEEAIFSEAELRIVDGR